MTKQETSDSTVDSTTDAGREEPAPSPGGDLIAELQAKVESLEDALLRSKAEYQNFQRRSNAERQDSVRFANAELMRSLLNVLDDFERSLAACSGDATVESIVAGERLVHENLLKALADNGLEVIDARGKPFDPAIHEALMQMPSDQFAPGTVVEQVTKGYRLRERVLRPARVIVAKAVVESNTSGESSDSAVE